ncbi:MAG: hypothetical protein H7098_12960 [Oligoflexus sp.]|nr:hypothetical protein [Pseudopedobacter sp.]
MIKTIIVPKDNHVNLIVPDNYIGKEVEVLLYRKDEIVIEKPTRTMEDFWGKISDETANDLNEKLVIGRNEWDRKIDIQ